MTVFLDRKAGLLFHAGRVFDPADRAWRETAPAVSGSEVGVREAARWLQLDSGSRNRVPIGVVGPREAAPSQLETAEKLGAAIAALGAVVICGGRQGVMTAVCRGVQQANGVSIGLLPDDSWDAANEFVSVPIATGLGVARNAVIARAALALVAVGGGYGTISEVAFALQFGRPVYGLADAPAIRGVHHVATVDEAIDALARLLLGLDPAPEP